MTEVQTALFIAGCTSYLVGPWFGRLDPWTSMTCIASVVALELAKIFGG